MRKTPKSGDTIFENKTWLVTWSTSPTEYKKGRPEVRIDNLSSGDIYYGLIDSVGFVEWDQPSGKVPNYIKDKVDSALRNANTIYKGYRGPRP